METKKPWQSKTNWVALVMAISAFFPFVQDAMVANPEVFMLVVSGVFAALRAISKGKISIK